MSKLNKVSKNEFISRISSRCGFSRNDVRLFYDAFIDEIRDVICEGRDLSLTGFGTFSIKQHKGHPVQFHSTGGSVDDYVVLKFTASDVLMDKIRKAYSDAYSYTSGCMDRGI